MDLPAVTAVADLDRDRAARSCRSGSAARPTTSCSTPTRSRSGSTCIPTIEGERHLLLRDHRAGRRLRRGEHQAAAPAATATTGSSTARRRSSPTATTPTSPSSSRSPTGRRAPATAAPPRSWSTGRWAGAPSSSRPWARAGPASLIFDDVRVPHRNILGEIGQGFDARHAVDRQGPLHHPVARHRHRRAGAADGDRLRQHPGDVRPADRRQPGDPVDDRRLGDRAGGGPLAGAARGVDGRPGPGPAARLVDGASSTAPAWSTGSSTGCCRSTAAWATPGSCRSSAGTGRSGCCRIFEGTDEMQRLIISRDLLRGYTKIGGHLA